MFCTSVSPMNAPLGFVFTVTAVVPVPIRTPVKVVAPVPPPPTGRVPYSTVVAPELTFRGCPAVPIPSLTNLVALLTRMSPAACDVAVTVLSEVLIVLFVRVRVSVVPTNSPVRETRFLRLSFDNPKSGIVQHS